MFSPKCSPGQVCHVSEMIGVPTNMPWAFVFTNIDNIPRHPAQLYEAVYCGLIFGLIFYLWHRKRHQWSNGVLFGMMISILFSFRFIDEFFKENQEAFENEMIINMGQILSTDRFLAHPEFV